MLLLILTPVLLLPSETADVSKHVMFDFLFQIEIDEDDVDDRFRSLFGQLAGGVSC